MKCCGIGDDCAGAQAKGAISICADEPNACFALPKIMSALPPLEITVKETQRLLSEHAATTVLIDVREAHEVELCRIAGATHIPMQQIPAQLGSLPNDKHLLIHCHHGGRSLRVTQFLRSNGFENVSNVAGGIEAWSLTIDPTVPRY
jgi:adenylyltransferase/sulfurtransferase